MSLWPNRRRTARDLSAVVVSIGESTTEQCIRTIEEQTLKPSVIEVVRNVSPAPLAYNEGLGRVGTEYYVSVDADMILGPRAFQHLYNAITKADDFFQAIAWLMDPLMGRIDGIRIYRTDIIKKLGGFPDVRGPLRSFTPIARDAGYRHVHVNKVAGVHHPAYTPLEAFNKFRESCLRTRRFSGKESWLNTYQMLISGYAGTKDLIYIFALAGLLDGLKAPQDELDSPQTSGSYAASPGFDPIRRYLEDD